MWRRRTYVVETIEYSAHHGWHAIEADSHG
jgi:hypothetical protein